MIRRVNYVEVNGVMTTKAPIATLYLHIATVSISPIATVSVVFGKALHHIQMKPDVYVQKQISAQSIVSFTRL